MYILLNWVIDESIYIGYFQIKNLNFSPQVDLTGNSLPANQYTVDVVMPDGLPGELTQATLYDDIGQIWSKWPPTKVQRITETYYRVTCTSRIMALDYVELEPTMYEGEDASNVIDDCIGRVTAAYSVAEDLQSIPITGFCPAQTARERLTWALFAIGAYADDTYTERIEIKAVDDTPALIPLEHTFMRPAEDAREWVTGLSITAYTFREGTEEEWQSDENSYQFPTPWIATPQTFTLTNPDAPAYAPENIVELDSLYLVNPTNVSGILTRLAKYWFNPKEVQLDCINNRAYKPGDLVQAYIDTDRMVLGYIQQMNSRFGLQSRSMLKLIGTNAVPTARLIVRYKYQNANIGKAQYYLPVGVAFSIDNPYLDQTKKKRRRIYRPTTAKAEGTMVVGGMTVNVNYEIALELYNGVLHIISVDEVTDESSGGEQIGVIE